MSEIRHLIEVASPPDALWPLVAEGSGLTRWWAADVTALPGEPGIVDVGFFGRSTTYRLRRERTEPRREVAWRCETGKEWGRTLLVFRLEPTAKGTALRFSHAEWREETDYFVSCNTVWGALMFRLKSAAEGKSPGPLFSAAGLAY